MFARPLIAAINHVLAGEQWARERLRPFAGQHARIEAGPLIVGLAIGGDGLFVAGGAEDEAGVVISLPGDTPFRYLADPASVLTAAKLSGSAEFAETLAFVFRNLRWDAEGELAKVVGDIAAHRLAKVGRTALAWQMQAAGNAMANLAEYVTEERDLVAPKREVTAFCQEVDHLRDDVARLEKRLARL